MGSLRDRHDDPWEAIATGLALFGVDPCERVLGYASDGAVEDALDDVAGVDDRDDLAGAPGRCVEAWDRAYNGVRHDEDARERAWERVDAVFEALLPHAGVDYDWPIHYVVAELDDLLGTRAPPLGLSYETHGDADRPDLDSPHPEAFRVQLLDATDGTVLEGVDFRPPPLTSASWASQNRASLVAVVNGRLLADRDLEVVELRGDLEETYALVERSRLDDLESEFGDGVPLFGEVLVGRTAAIAETALEKYDPSNAVDHDERFGRPEPDGTISVEDRSDRNRGSDGG